MNMKNITTIIKKELYRVFRDIRLSLTTFIFPGLMIFALYSIIGNALQVKNEAISINYNAIIVNAPSEYTDLLSNMNENVSFVISNDIEESVAKEEILTAKSDIYIAFENDFNSKIANGEKPKVKIYYNPGEEKSSDVYNITNSAIEVYRSTLINQFYGDVSLFTSETNQIFEEKKVMANVISLLLPFLIITFLFSGAMSIAPESIAGEKERGTFATLLITPTKRSEIALGKIISLSILSTISAISSFIGVILSLPKLMGVSGMGANIYGVGDYLLVLLVLVATVLIIVGFISIISAFAKNVKEASMYVLPLYIISMVIGITTMFGNSSSMNDFLFLIPIYNSVQVLAEIFTFEINITHLIVTIISNVCYTGIIVFILTRMFNNEKIMFAK